MSEIWPFEKIGKLLFDLSLDFIFDELFSFVKDFLFFDMRLNVLILKALKFVFLDIVGTGGS